MLPGRGVQPGLAEASAGDPYLTAAEEERQAAWYGAQRREIYRQIGLRRLRRVLDVGCGTGVITAELAAKAAGAVVGVDTRVEPLGTAAAREGDAVFLAADAAQLPFRAGAFDAVACAFTVMWLAAAAEFLGEANRVLARGGFFVAFAEPDYAAAIDYPPPASAREAVVDALERRGGDAAAGRKLPGLLKAAGFDLRSLGVLNAVWTPSRWRLEEEGELAKLERLLACPDVAGTRLAAARAAAIASGERFYFLPVIYAVARKPGNI
jgi:SAM-dependent methyltransferase